MGGYFHLPELSLGDFGFFRTPGPGLGNLLFPIARALVGQQRLGGTFVYPTLRQVKVGTLLRRERDPRFYGGEFRPRRATEWRDWMIASSRPRCPEAQVDRGRTTVTIGYSGLGRYFHDLVNQRDIVRAWIEANATRLGAVRDDYDLGIHVRLGDFRAASTGGNGHAIRQTFDWYRTAHATACELLGRSPEQTMLFTDEDPAQIAQALGISGVRPDPSRNAITAILNLSRARVIITSRSTFSMWAAYLGNATAIWNADLDLGRSWPTRPGLDFTV